MTLHRTCGLLAALAALTTVAWLDVNLAARQEPPAASGAAAAAPAAAGNYAAPKTAWGDPDFQGVWSHFDETPLQAPNPDAEARAAERANNVRRYGGVAEGKGDGPGGGMSREMGRPVSPTRKALVVEPVNNRIPVKQGINTLRDYDRMGDHWLFHGPGERCITRSVPAGMFTGLGYGRAVQILQSPGYVVIFPEMIHDPRIVPVDGRPHVGGDIRLWNGDSRGRWEGQTLVVETTNYNDKGVVLGELPQTQTLRVVERFTRVDEKTINHEIVYEDPAVFSSPWKVVLPHNLDPEYQIYEYACHEGNTRYMTGALKLGRDRDAEQAGHSKTKRQ